MKFVLKILFCSLLFVTLGITCFAHSVVDTQGTVYYSRYPIRNIISRSGIENIYTERMVYNSTRALSDSYSGVNFEGISNEYNVYENRLYLGYMRPSAIADYFDYSNSLAYKEVSSSRYFPLSTVYIVPQGCSLNVQSSGVYTLYFNDNGNVSSYSVNLSDFLRPYETGLYSLEVYGNTLNYLLGALPSDYEVYLLDIESSLVTYLDSYSGIPVGVFSSSVGYGLSDVSIACTCVDSNGNETSYLYAIDSYELFDTRMYIDSSVTSAVLYDSVDSFVYDNIGSERASLFKSLSNAFDNDFVLGFTYNEMLYLVFAITVLRYVLNLILGG